jgi:hypothetical protein
MTNLKFTIKCYDTYFLFSSFTVIIVFVIMDLVQEFIVLIFKSLSLKEKESCLKTV